MRRRRTDRTATIGLFALVVVLGFFGVVYSGLYRKPFAPSTTTVKAVFDDTSQLKKGDPVRVRGVKVGTVSALDLDDGGRTATVTMKVEKEGLPVYRDASAFLRWRTALGGNFAVDLDRGNPRSGELGATAIPRSRTENQVELDDVLGVLRRPQRGAVRKLSGETPKALSNPNAVRDALDQLTRSAPNLKTAVRALRGRSDGDLTRLVQATSRLVAELDAPGAPLRDVVRSGAVTLNALAAQRGAIADTLRLAPAVLPPARSTLQRVDVTLGRADRLVAALRGPAPEVGPAVRRLRPVVTGADRLLRDARPLLRDLPPTTSALVQTANDAAPALRELTPSIDRVNDSILPYLDKKDPVSQRSTAEMIGPTFASTNGAMADYDAGSNIFRFPASVQATAFDDVPCQVLLANPERGSTINCNDLRATLARLLGEGQPTTPRKAAKR